MAELRQRSIQQSRFLFTFVIAAAGEETTLRVFERLVEFPAFPLIAP